MSDRVVVVLSLLALGLGCSLRKDAIRGDAGVDHPDAGKQDLRPEDTTGPVAGSGALPGTGGNGTGSGGSAGIGSGGALGSGGSGMGGAPVQNNGGKGGAPAQLKDLATTCSSKAECASGNCVDGVCCDGECADSCSACNLKDFVGHCSAVPAGAVAPAPHPACPKMAASTCKQNGFCDGKGACQVFPSGEACSGGTCSSATQMSVTGSTCDGMGTCKPAAAVACAPFKCDLGGTSCATSCTSDTDCQGQPCVGGSCGKVADGNKCTTAAQCTSGNCVDGFCCNLACTSSCQACDLTGSIGKCTPLPPNQAPRNGRANCAAGTCGSHCDGTSASCVFTPKTTSCGSAKCVPGMATAAVNCDGLGACPTAAMTPCGGIICAGAVCKATCVDDTECLAPLPYCNTGTGKCQATKPLGHACVAGTECAVGNCVNGVCCSTTSCSTCQACNLATPGTCSNKPPAAADSACVASKCQTGTCNGSGACTVAGDGAMCGTNMFCKTGACGSCTPNQSCTPMNMPCKTGMTMCGSGTMACGVTGNQPLNTPCGPGASCSGTTLTRATVCDSTGGCPTPTTSPCPNGCNATKDACFTCTGGLTACNGMCCAATKPVCLGGTTCVECNSDASCPSTKPTCDLSTHTCGCRKKSSANLLLNPNFDTEAQVTPDWVSDTLFQSWTSDDADGCQASGSIFGQIYLSSPPCVAILPGVTYRFGLRYKTLPGPDPQLRCNVDVFATTLCDPTDPVLIRSPSLVIAPSTSWASASASYFNSTTQAHARLFCGQTNTTPGVTSYVDQLYLNGSANSF